MKNLVYITLLSGICFVATPVCASDEQPQTQTVQPSDDQQAKHNHEVPSSDTTETKEHNDIA